MRRSAMLAAALLSPAAGAAQTLPVIDGEAALETVRALAADEMAGRAAGTEGGRRAREYLLGRLRAMGAAPVDGRLAHPFTARDRTGAEVRGVNLLFRIDGADPLAGTIVVTAHYDHLGTADGEIYNGADDNASGVAGLLAIARRFMDSPPRHTFLFALLDAEERGLLGARALVESLPAGDLALNINLDMIGRSAADELYAAGTRHSPRLAPLVERLARRAPLALLTGHDSPDGPGDDWTFASDHGAFHRAGVPFLYFGVEDHPDYHTPRDTFENLDPDFFLRAVQTVVMAADAVDREMSGLP